MIKINDYKHYYITEDGEVYSSYLKKNLKKRPNSKGYLRVSLSKNNKQKNFFIHRLIAKYFLGTNIDDSTIQINHKDSNKTNNKIENLEIIDNRNNSLHSKVDSDGFIGSYDKSRNKWVAQIYFNKKKYYIGRYNTKKEATIAYLEKAKELGIEIKYVKINE